MCYFVISLISIYIYVVFFLLGDSLASYNSDAWDLPKRKNTTFTTRPKFGIKNVRTCFLLLYQVGWFPCSRYSCSRGMWWGIWFMSACRKQVECVWCIGCCEGSERSQEAESRLSHSAMFGSLVHKASAVIVTSSGRLNMPSPSELAPFCPCAVW